ncbi:hypothetical protein K3495_g8717 [Podosphaera aphanis]|nr:hypothetical protein K3495_g8717 [Podosphaera aphanis]
MYVDPISDATDNELTNIDLRRRYLTMNSSRPKSRSYRARTTRDQRLQAKTLRSTGLTYLQISRQLGISHRQVQTIITSDDINPGKSTGRRSVLSEEQVDELEAFVCSSATNRQMAYLELAIGPFQHWGVSEKVIGSVLKKRGFSRQRAHEKPILTEESRKVRKEWARTHLNWSVNDWEKVLWTYGNWGSNTQWANTFMTMKSEEKLTSPCLTSRAKKRTSWIFWGSFVGSEKGPCLYWEKEWGSINSEKYCEKIIPLLDEMVATNPWLSVVQDNITSNSITDTNDDLHQRFISTINWPPDSPDLSPIEPIWESMKTFIQKKNPDLDRTQRTPEELRAIVMEAWGSITSEELTELVQSMPERCQAVLNADGDYIKY